MSDRVEEIVWLRRLFIYERDNNESIQKHLMDEVDSLKKQNHELIQKYTEQSTELKLITDKIKSINT
tara:strand:+ start:644 stop:844 length:201 start_codon:yes stop_codon:yes gene_type:complete